MSTTMRELDDIKARREARLESLTMPSADITGYGPPPTIVSREHAEAEIDLDRAIAIAEREARRKEFERGERSQAVRERDEAADLSDYVHKDALKAFEPALACCYEFAANSKSQVDRTLAQAAIDKTWAMMRDALAVQR